MHCAGLRCRTRKDLKEKMTEFLECEQPIVGEFCIDKNGESATRSHHSVVYEDVSERLLCGTEHTLPMVPAGARLHDMVLCPGQSPMTEEERYADMGM